MEHQRGEMKKAHRALDLPFIEEQETKRIGTMHKNEPKRTQ